VIRVPWRQELLDVHVALGNTTILCADGADLVHRARAGDAVYLDPPYLPRAAGGFTTYTGAGFGLPEHQRLVKAARSAIRRGARVAISNHDTEDVPSLYRGDVFHLDRFPVARAISRRGSDRVAAQEILATGGPRASV
jgi:DNA adenine methylase